MVRPASIARNVPGIPLLHPEFLRGLRLSAGHGASSVRCDAVDRHKTWGPTTQFNAVRAALRVFNWAVKQKILDVSPLKGMERPRPKNRDKFISDEDFQKLFRAASKPFKLFLFALRRTGARPSEVRGLTWDQVRDDCWVLKEHKTSGKAGKPRVIYLTPAMQKLMKFLRKHSESK